MAKYTFATLDKWAQKTERRATAIVKQATNDMLNGIDISEGIMRGGSFQRGTIPRDNGNLARSLMSELYGSAPVKGEDSYTMAINNMGAGDVIQFSWGGVDAPYAKAIHYGFKTYPGTFWRDDAAAQWQRYVAAATAKAKAMVK